MNRLHIALVAFTFCIPLMSSAQKVITASGEYTYYAPREKSVAEAESIALERAKVQIIADRFGTVVGVSNFTRVSNSAEASDLSFLSLGESEVRGEWLGTVGEPEFEEFFEKGVLVVRVKVTGKIRELKAAKAPFEAKVLRNGTDDSNEDDKFFHRDDIYISFKSSVNGYVAVYLYNLTDGVNRLLPKKNQQDGSIGVRGGRREILLAEADGRAVYRMTCDGDVEYNRIYVIFSPNKFTRPIDDIPDKGAAYLSFDDFERWFTKARRQDTEMGFITKEICITPKH